LDMAVRFESGFDVFCGLRGGAKVTLVVQVDAIGKPARVTVLAVNKLDH